MFVNKLHHGLEGGSVKKAVGEIVESTWVEALIVLLVFADLALLGVEHGIDHHHLCIAGQLVPMAPDALAAHAESHASHSFLAQVPSDVLDGGFANSFRDVGHSVDIQEPARATLFAQTETITRQLVKPSVQPLIMLRAGWQKSKHRQLHEDVGGSYDAVARSEADGFLDPRNAASYETEEAHIDGPLHGDDHDGHEEGHGEGTAHSKGHDGHEEAHGAGKSEGHGGHGEVAHGHHHVDEALICDTRKGPAAHEVVHVCHTASVIILTFFLFEILCKVWVNAVHFFQSPVEVLDLVVVSISLLVDLFVVPMIHDPKHIDQVEFLLVVLIICRFWRIVRILHGLFEIAQHHIHHEDKLRKKIDLMATDLAKYTKKSPAEIKEQYAKSANSAHH